ncbi:MAG: S8 family serine peptidase, partial [Chloroflexaceae bacterium]|nr:S8 family serine peptidase [Chloroflexaceae bacterium]
MRKRLFLVLALLIAVIQAAAVAAQPFQPASPSIQQPATLLVRFHADWEPADQIATIEAVGLRREQIVEELPELHIIAVELASTAPSATEIIAQLTAQPGVEYAELSQEYRLIPDVEAEMPPSLQAEPTAPEISQTPAFTPNDPSLNQQYALTRMQAFSAWSVTQGSPNIIIAVVDSGVAPTHPDLEGKLVAGPDLIDGGDTRSDPHGHGTWVAGVAAARTNNSLGIAGMCPNCRVMPVRAMRADGSGSTTTIANAITAAVDGGASIINLSLGGASDSPTLRNAVNYAWSNGAFVVCAAGNAGTNQRFFPAAYENCFSVAATDSNDGRASFS